MKNKKICPKCSGTDIILIPGKVGAYGVGNNIQVGWSNFSAVLVNRYSVLSQLQDRFEMVSRFRIMQISAEINYEFGGKLWIK